MRTGEVTRNKYILEMLGILKEYPGVTALKEVNFRTERKTVHCLIGGNGAGKSTLIKILTCAEQMTQGKILLDGKIFTGRTVKDAMNAGISTVFQELNIIDELSVEENLTLGREHHKGGIISKDIPDPSFAVLEEFAPDISLKTRVSALSFAQKQVVEIVKAISIDAKIVVLDEPTAALSQAESESLYKIVRKLKSKGITVIYISHVLDDIFAIGDYVTVLRDGEIVGTVPVHQTTRDELVKMMTGKEIHSNYSAREGKQDTLLLEAKKITTSSIHKMSFTLKKGEILGFYGLRGAGKSETARTLFGLDKLISGTIEIEGNPVIINNPRKAIQEGISMVPEERLSEGIFDKLSVTDNVAVSNYSDVSHIGVINNSKTEKKVHEYVNDLEIKLSSIKQRASTLSGGNQQKVVFAKCLNMETKLLILDEPTRGVDVGAKEEIYSIIRRLAEENVGIIVCSSEYDEIAVLCDRVVLIGEGQVITTLAHEELDTQHVHMLIMNGGEKR